MGLVGWDKDGGLIRSAITSSLHFTRAQFSASHFHSHRVQLTAADPLPIASYTTEWEG